MSRPLWSLFQDNILPLHLPQLSALVVVSRSLCLMLLPLNLLQASTFSRICGNQRHTLSWSLLWDRALALALALALEVTWSYTDSAGSRYEGYFTGSFILYLLIHSWSPEYGPCTGNTA